MAFEIIIHEHEHEHEHEIDKIVEIIYPEAPTAAEIDAYIAKVRATIDAQQGSWSCLVDQRKLIVLPPELVDRLAEINRYAERRGMVRAARVIASAVGSLQTNRMARSMRIPVIPFTSREEALAWLRGEAPDPVSTRPRSSRPQRG